MTHTDGASVAGALLGLALGDALGFVVEAESPGVALAYVEALRAGRAGSRAHPAFPFGQYSDDTQLARELLVAVAESGGWDPAAFGKRLAALVRGGRDVGAGPATRGAARRLLLGAPWTHAGAPPPYAGNGSAMRVAPLGALYHRHDDLRRRTAREQSLVTHRDPRCTAAAVVVAEAAALAARPERLEPRAAIEHLARVASAEDERMAAAVREAGYWLDLPAAAALERLHTARLDPAWTPEWLGISAHVVPSVAWSLYAAFRSPDDWWEAVCTAIVPGGDTDTMAAIAGAIAGARAGPDVLSPPLLAQLNDRGSWGAAALTELAHRCVATLQRPSTPPPRML